MSTDIAKAGWMHRQSSVLKRWKRQWFVLYRDGCLKYYDGELSSRAEDVHLLPGFCMQVYGGTQVVDVTPPEGISESCLLKLVFHKNHLVMCAETPDDMSAWQMTINEARQLRQQPVARTGQQVVTVQGVPAAGPQVITVPGAPIQTYQYYNTYTPGMVGPVPAQTTVICTADPYMHRRYYRHRPLWWW